MFAFSIKKSAYLIFFPRTAQFSLSSDQCRSPTSFYLSHMAVLPAFYAV